MDELSFQVPTKVHFGLGVLNRAGQIASQCGSRALLIVDSVLGDETSVQAVKDYLRKSGVESILFSEMAEGSTSTSIEEALEFCRSSRADLVIGMGGIRVLSYAKCVARLAPNEGSVDDYFAGRGLRGAEADTLAYVEIPTTCRDPFMLTDDCLIVDARNRHTSIFRIGKKADAAIIDPALTLTLSPKLTVATMLDTLLSAIESYFSRHSTFLSETLSLRAVGVVTSIMDELAQRPQERDLRIQASQAGLLLSLSLTMSTQGIGTAVAYAACGKLVVPKSIVAAVMIPHVLEMGLLSQPKKVERIGNVLGEEIYGKPLSEFSVQVVEAVRQRMGLFDVPMRLKELELALDDMAEIAQIAHELPISHFLAEPVSPDTVHELIKRAF